MAIRKDLDDMLNNLKVGADTGKTLKPVQPAKAPVHKPTKADAKIDHMSVDDLLSTLSHEKEEPVKAAPVQAAPVQAPTVQMPEKPKKKKIVISGELPDYEAIRQADLEKDRLEAERKAAEEAKKKLIEAEKRAAEEAERKRLEAEKRAAEEAERKRLEAEKRAAEEAERKRLEAEKKAAEEAERKRLEAEKRAAEEAAAEPAPVSFEEEINVVASSRTEDSLDRELTVDELMAAAFAAVKAENEASEEAEPVQEEAPAAEEAPAEEEVPAEPETEPDPVANMIDTIREDAEKKLSDLEKPAEPEQEAPAETEAAAESDTEAEAEPADKAEERKKRFFSMKKSDDEDAEPDEPAEKPKGRLTATLERIMDEDPEEIIAERSEKAEDDEFGEPENGKLKKRLYTIFGVIFAVLACIGLITVIAKSVSFFGSFTSGNAKKSGFAEVVYPAVIMDIESFDDPTQLTSDQVITAAIWSMIMTDGTLDQYEKTFDVVRVPAVDVESYAVKLFGDSLPELTHTTVGPAESRFYYNEEKESYNVPLTPITFTYSPEIKSVSKNGSDYTLVVDYIDELPEWLPKTSSKSVQFKLTETNDGYQIKAMKVLSENNSI